MQKGQFVKNIGAHDAVEALFVIAEASQQQAKNGPFWRLVLKDATGQMDAKIWSPLSMEFPALAAGQIALVRGRASLYREQVQLTIEGLELLTEEQQAQVALEDFMSSSPRPLEVMHEELLSLIRQEFTHSPWRKLVLQVFTQESIAKRFCLSPAAKGVHHAYVGGLLEHTLGVARFACAMALHYPQLDKQTLLAGALFHDIGKIEEFSGGLVNDYTDAGRLMGHIELGLELLAPFFAKASLAPELIQHVKHLILSHHGQPEFGAARIPQTAEAFALHYADNMDAKMAQCRQLFEDVPTETGWTPYQATLGRFMHKAMKSPETAEKPEKARPRKVVQKECLSLLKV
jgi:3'-5' exoribonuclease